MAKFSDEDYFFRENIKNLLKKMERDCDAFIVEGKNDEKVLKALGVSKKIFRVSKREIGEFCDTISHCSDDVVILVDFDKAGKKINKELLENFKGNTNVLSSYRKKFGKLLTSKDRFCIEDIRPLLNKGFDKFDEVKLSRLYSNLV